ncbi:MAG: hypothetical protein JWM78_3365 [Verrucomicrobiaceae bacterium]|nr:hypothetical protein [Verrucomicrobiaceae bacterium]
MINQHRLDFLDGLRGFAILMVVCLHYFAQVEHVPRSEFYNVHTPLRYGDFGVQLFFVISGYVIFMTLDKTANFTQFILRRWIRLFPAMLICTLIIAAASYFVPYRPGGIPRLIDVFPGLTFLGAHLVSGISGIPTDGLERGFWTLYIEFRFYLMFGAAYFLLGQRKSFFTLMFLSIVLLCLFQITQLWMTAYTSKGEALFAKALLGYQLPWFLLGMYVYLFEFKQHIYLAFLLVGNALVYNLGEWGASVAALVIVLIVYLAFTAPWFQKVCRMKLFLFFGFISYPLYLLNDSLGRGIIRGSYEYFAGRVPFELLPFVALSIIVLPTWCVAKYVEPPIQRLLKRVLLRRNAMKVTASI